MCVTSADSRKGFPDPNKKRTKKKAKKVHEVQHDCPWKPGYQPRKHSPEDLEIMLNYCLGKDTIGDTKAKLLRTK